MSCKRSAKTQLPAMASNSHRGLPQRLSKRCLALIIPRIKQAHATHQLKLLKLENKIKKHQEQLKIKNQLRSTQGYARRTTTGQHTKEVSTFPLERRSRWAEPGLKGETERRGGSSPCSSSRLGIWESPHLSLDLGESPHPVS